MAVLKNHLLRQIIATKLPRSTLNGALGSGNPCSKCLKHSGLGIIVICPESSSYQHLVGQKMCVFETLLHLPGRTPAVFAKDCWCLSGAYTDRSCLSWAYPGRCGGRHGLGHVCLLAYEGDPGGAKKAKPG